MSSADFYELYVTLMQWGFLNGGMGLFKWRYLHWGLRLASVKFLLLEVFSSVHGHERAVGLIDSLVARLSKGHFAVQGRGLGYLTCRSVLGISAALN